MPKQRHFTWTHFIRKMRRESSNCSASFTDFYHPEEIISANRDGRYISFVVRTPENRVIGVSHLFPSAPYRGLYENGVALVHPDYRKSKAFRELSAYIDEYIPRHPAVEVLWGESVCNHLISQKMALAFQVIETGLEIALMPVETYSKEQSSAGRVAALNSFRSYASRPHQIFIPKVYENILKRIYDRLDDRREFAVAGEGLPADLQTQIQMSVFESAGVARMTIAQILLWSNTNSRPASKKLSFFRSV